MAILNWEVVRYSICCLVSSGLRGRMFQCFTALWTREIGAFAAGTHFGCSTVTPNFGDFFPFVGIFETIFVGWFPFSEFFGSMAVAQETPEPVEEELRLIQSIFGWTDCSNGLGDLLQVCILLRRKHTLHSLRLFFVPLVPLWRLYIGSALFEARLGFCMFEADLPQQTFLLGPQIRCCATRSWNPMASLVIWPIIIPSLALGPSMKLSRSRLPSQSQKNGEICQPQQSLHGSFGPGFLVKGEDGVLFLAPEVMAENLKAWIVCCLR